MIIELGLKVRAARASASSPVRFLSLQSALLAWEAVRTKQYPSFQLSKLKIHFSKLFLVLEEEGKKKNKNSTLHVTRDVILATRPAALLMQRRAVVNGTIFNRTFLSPFLFSIYRFVTTPARSRAY